MTKFKLGSASTDEKEVRTPRWAIAVVLVTSLSVGACGGTPRSAATALPSAEALRQNDRILRSVPAVPGAQLAARNDIEGPKGGKGAGSYLYYRADNVDRADIVGHFKASLVGWSVLKEESFPARQTVTFARGDAWLQVSATDIAGSVDNPLPVPGYVVVVNARDAKVMTPRSGE